MKKIALIIGAQKSGTTSLFNYLAEHPEICPSSVKEPGFFGDNKRFNKGIDSYLSLWDCKPQHQVSIEASVVYTMSPRYRDVADRISTASDIDFHFIYIMRNPLKRIESNITHAVSTGVLKKAAVTDNFISFSSYATQLDPFVEKFGRQKLHLLLLEDLKQNPQLELNKIYEFLSLKQYKHPAETLTVYNKKTDNHFKAPTFVWTLYRSKMIADIMSRIPKGIKSQIINLLPTQKQIQFSLSEPEKQKILQTLAPDLRRLKYDYGVNFEHQWHLPIDIL